jgi:heat-inducible transcriptional repressor
MLSQRRLRILNVVAENYIASARAVPSALVADQLQVSSATVRNEYSALEHLGMLQQPHASAGRIPTSTGLAAYARRFIPPRKLRPEQRLVIRKRLGRQHGDLLFQNIASLAAELSGYAVVVSLPADDMLRALEIHLTVLSANKLLAVLVLENGLVRQQIVHLSPVPSDDVIGRAERSLRSLTVPLSHLPAAVRSLAAGTTGELARTLAALADALPALNPPRLFSHGLGNLFQEPEARDPEFLRLALSQVEAPGPGTQAAGALDLVLSDATAQISATFQLGSLLAHLSIIGPARMRYPEALQVSRGIADMVAEPATDEAGR